MRGGLARSACETNRAVTIYRGQAISMFADFSTPRRSSQKCRPGSHSGTQPRPSHDSWRLFRSARVRVARDGSEFHRPKTYVALRRQTRKLPGESRMLRGGAGEIHQFFSDRIVKRTPAAGTQGRALFGSGPSWTMSLFGNRGLGPHSRIAGLLLFPLLPSRGNCLSATTGFGSEWGRNRFACRNVLLWRFSGRPNWRSR